MSGPEVLPEGSVSQIFVLGLSFDCILKKLVTFCHFFNYKFLQNLGPISQF